MVNIASMDDAALAKFLPKMAPGQTLVYHVGSLMYDRAQDGPYSRRVDDIAAIVYASCGRGEVTLVQRRLAPLKYEYVALGRARATSQRSKAR